MKLLYKTVVEPPIELSYIQNPTCSEVAEKGVVGYKDFSWLHTRLPNAQTVQLGFWRWEVWAPLYFIPTHTTSLDYYLIAFVEA